MISILAFTKMEGSEAIAAYRVLWPLEYLGKRKDFGPCHVIAEKGIEHIMATGGARKLLGYDIYIFQRLLAPMEGSFFDILKEQGSKLVLEADDDISDKHRDLGHGQWLQPTIDQMDAVTVSTPHLKKVMEPYGKPYLRTVQVQRGLDIIVGDAMAVNNNEYPILAVEDGDPTVLSLGVPK